MAQDISEVLKQAMALPNEARAALAGALPDSVDETVDGSAEAVSSGKSEMFVKLEFRKFLRETS